MRIRSSYTYFLTSDSGIQTWSWWLWLKKRFFKRVIFCKIEAPLKTFKRNTALKNHLGKHKCVNKNQLSGLWNVQTEMVSWFYHGFIHIHPKLLPSKTWRHVVLDLTLESLQPKLDLVALQLHIVQPRPWLTVRSLGFGMEFFRRSPVCCKHLHKGKWFILNVWKLSSQNLYHFCDLEKYSRLFRHWNTLLVISIPWKPLSWNMVRFNTQKHI